MITKVQFPSGFPNFFSIFLQHNGLSNSNFPQLFNSLNSKKPFEKNGDFEINLDDEGLVFVYDDFRDHYKSNNPVDKIKHCFMVKVTSKSLDSFHKFKYQFTPITEKSIADLCLIPNRTDRNKSQYFRVADQKQIISTNTKNQKDNSYDA